MHQLIFSSQCKQILAHMSQEQQMQLMDVLGAFDFTKTDHYGKIVRGSKVYYRLRWEGFRIYFESGLDSAFHIHYLLPKHTWNDFLFRSKLPFDEEMVEKDNRFWQYLESLKK